MLKQESLTKLKHETLDGKQIQYRTIMWQYYDCAMLFCNIFQKIKQRLKDLLRDNVIYADGLTPQEVAKYVYAVKNC